MTSNDKIFPVLDRPAPIVEQLREEDNTQDLTDSLSQLIADSVQSDDEQLKEETYQELVSKITTALAAKLGVQEEDVNAGFIEQLGSMLINVDESDVLTDDAMEKLGIIVEESMSAEEETLFD